MLDNEGKAEALKAIADLIDRTQDNTISGPAAALLTAAYQIENRTLLENRERVEGVVLVGLGVDKGVTRTIEGAFQPELAYGAFVEAILYIWSRDQAQSFELPIKSMVTEMLAAAASLEKEVTQKPEH